MTPRGQNYVHFIVALAVTEWQAMGRLLWKFNHMDISFLISEL